MQCVRQKAFSLTHACKSRHVGFQRRQHGRQIMFFVHDAWHSEEVTNDIVHHEVPRQTLCNRKQMIEKKRTLTRDRYKASCLISFLRYLP
jgi:hypothetical protein